MQFITVQLFNNVTSQVLTLRYVRYFEGKNMLKNYTNIYFLISKYTSVYISVAVFKIGYYIKLI